MFLTLLLITFVLALAVSLLVMWLFNKPIRELLKRIIGEGMHAAWLMYIKFAILVVGVSSGVRIRALEKYITQTEPGPDGAVLPLPELTTERWVLELYRTIIETLQGIAWLLLVFFIFALIAYVIVRIFAAKTEAEGEDSPA